MSEKSSCHAWPDIENITFNAGAEAIAMAGIMASMPKNSTSGSDAIAASIPKTIGDSCLMILRKSAVPKDIRAPSGVVTYKPSSLFPIVPRSPEDSSIAP